ncbi:MAG: helix-turn-helix transcriptional regulator [Patescibacteria group bacterium]
MNQIEFGKLVAQKRKEFGISQLELGRRLKIYKKGADCATQKAISNIETGQGVGKRPLVNRICRFLKINPIPEIDQVPWQPTSTFGLFEPDASEEDIALIAQNLFIEKHLNQKLADMIKFECEKFRKTFET